ncbi:MAG: GDP-mannose 4,6-dehydratase, partial [Phycisphaerales bacterium]
MMVTGGAGYIGSHAVLRLVRDGHDVVVLDNLVRGHRQAIDAIERATGKHVELVVDDAGNLPVVTDVLRRRRVSAILHFAALAYVGESVERPLDYYRANTAAAIGLLEACNVAGV